jgi:hypothetical protein
MFQPLVSQSLNQVMNSQLFLEHQIRNYSKYHKFEDTKSHDCMDVYEVIPIDDSKTNNQSSYQDSLLSGNNDGTIPLSQGHALSNCKIANMDFG